MSFSPEFFGKGPTRWVIGQVVFDVENKVNEDRWGDRVRVRLIGYDSPEGSICADDDLRRGIVLKPTSQGSLNRGSTALVGGEWVIGFLVNDGSNKKTVMIVGVLGKSDPSYEMTQPQAIAKKSSEFLTTLNYFGTVLPTDYQTLGGTKDQSSKKAPTVPSAAGFGLKSDSDAEAGTTAQEAATAAAEAEEQSAARGTDTAAAQEAEGGTDAATAQEAATDDGFVEFRGDEEPTGESSNQSFGRGLSPDRALQRAEDDIGSLIVIPGGVPVNANPTPSQLQQMESNGFTYYPGEQGEGGKFIHKNQNFA